MAYQKKSAKKKTSRTSARGKKGRAKGNNLANVQGGRKVFGANEKHLVM